MEKNIQVAYFVKNKAPQLRTVPNTQNSLELLVGGPLGYFAPGLPGVYGYCNNSPHAPKNGEDLTLVVPLNGAHIFGPVVFCGKDGAAFRSLEPLEIEALQTTFNVTIKAEKTLTVPPKPVPSVVSLRPFERAFFIYLRSILPQTRENRDMVYNSENFQALAEYAQESSTIPEIKLAPNGISVTFTWEPVCTLPERKVRVDLFGNIGILENPDPSLSCTSLELRDIAIYLRLGVTSSDLYPVLPS